VNIGILYGKVLQNLDNSDL